MENTTIISADYSRALKLHKSIIANAQMAQECLLDVCKGLKDMRDNCLYKALGYDSFSSYCESDEIGLKRSQAYSYISIAENLDSDFVRSSGQLGMKKLYLLSTLSENERNQVDAENSTVKELKAQIATLREQSNADNQTIVRLSGQVKELEARPIEVKTVGITLEESEKKVAEAVEKLKEQHDKQFDELMEEYDSKTTELNSEINRLTAEVKNAAGNAPELERQLEQAREQARQTEANHAAELESIKAQFAEKLRTAANGDNKLVFKVHLKTCIDAFNACRAFLTGIENQDEKSLYNSKLSELLDKLKGGI